MSDLKKFMLYLVLVGCGGLIGWTSHSLHVEQKYDFYRVKVHTNPMDGNYLSCNNCHKLGNVSAEVAMNSELEKLSKLKSVTLDSRTTLYGSDIREDYKALGAIFCKYYSQYYGENSKTARMRLLYVTTLERDLSAVLRQICPQFKIENYYWKWFHTDLNDSLLFEFKTRTGETFFLFTKFTESKNEILK